MRGVNKVIIVGNLGADPEVRQFGNGGSVTNISVATSERWTDKQTGEPKEQTEWHRVAMFNRLGEVAAQYLRKGSSVYVEGSLRTRKWQDENGNDRYSTEIRADSMQMLGGNPGGGQGGAAGGGQGYGGNQGNNQGNQGYGGNSAAASQPAAQSGGNSGNQGYSQPAQSSNTAPLDDDDLPF